MKSWKYEKDTSTGEVYAVYHSVPIFKEHTGSDGTKYTQELLEAIADNNNDRIEETGDYCPIVGWHTPSDNDPSKDPPIIGFAENFRVEKFGKKQPKWCIYATFKIRKDKHGYFRDHPRRSVEIWPEDKPENRYIDPIAVLGAETPRQDLGLVYSKSAAGEESYMYSSVAGGGNTYVPKQAKGKDMEYAKDEEGQEPDKNYAQIAAALAPVAGELIGGLMGGGDKNAKKTGPRPIRKPRAKGFKFDKDEMPQDVPGDDDVLDGDDEMALDQQSVQQIVEGLKPTIIDIVQEEIASIVGDQGMGPEDMLEDQEVEVVPDEEVEDMLQEEPEEEVMAEEPEAEEVPEEEEEEEVERNSKEEYAKELFAKMAEKHSLYSKEADYKSASQYMASMEDADRNAMEQYMCGGKPSKEEKDAYAKCAECDKAMKDSYSKSSEVAEADKYRKELKQEADKYSKLQQQYSKLQSELVEAKDQLTEVRRSERYHKIADRLSNLEAEGYSFDKEKELEFCMQLSDELREEHLAERIPQQYAKCPVGAPIPVEESEELKPIEQKSIKYSQAANLATQKLRAQGNKGVSFDKVLKHMCDNDTDECPSVEDLK